MTALLPRSSMHHACLAGLKQRRIIFFKNTPLYAPRMVRTMCESPEFTRPRRTADLPIMRTARQAKWFPVRPLFSPWPTFFFIVSRLLLCQGPRNPEPHGGFSWGKAVVSDGHGQVGVRLTWSGSGGGGKSPLKAASMAAWSSPAPAKRFLPNLINWLRM